ncbi:MAG: hypothetical protein NTV01_06690, partial [Bacteroidia bacterium]|nr:hypothetical protein [Bacteroidia bacterium]
LIALCLITSCKSKKPEVKKATPVSTESLLTRKVKDEIIKVAYSLPTNTETVNLINATGASYLAGVTGQDMKTGNLLTRNERATAYGTLLFDLAYTHTYKQVEPFSKLLKIFGTLTSELGFEELVQMQKSFQVDYQEHKDNKDSLNVLVANLLNKTNESIRNNGTAVDISLVVAGAALKSLNVITNITLFAKNPDKLIEVLKNQKTVVSSVCAILEKSPENPDVSKLYKSLVPINDLFNSPETFNVQTVEKINKLTGFISK